MMAICMKKFFENNGILSNENNSSFSLNTDGAPLFKSSSVSIWPVYMLVSELPRLDFKQKNPQMWSFLNHSLMKFNI